MSLPIFLSAFLGCWLIAVAGGYLAVLGLSNVRGHGFASAPIHPHAVRRPDPLLRRGLLVVWDGILLLLGGLLMVMGMVLFYLLVYG
jgi:hypothetical protein